MRNQTKRVFTHKSKVFLTILCMLGLVFSWSCSCKNRVSNPDDTPTDGGTPPPPPGTFSISEATDNVKASIVKSSTTSISDIKIGFVSANNYAYSLTYTVEDSETDETKKITADDFQVANNVLTAKDSVATKMKQVDSSTAPVEKTITINFTFTANDKTLNNNTQTLPVEVKLTHAQSLDGDTGATAIEAILKKGVSLEDNDNQPGGNKYEFSYSTGTFDKNNNTFTITHRDSDKWLDGITYSRIYQYTDYNFEEGHGFEGLTGTRVGAGELSADKKSFTLTYNVTFSDIYDTTITQIKIAIKIADSNNNISFKDDTTSGS